MMRNSVPILAVYFWCICISTFIMSRSGGSLHYSHMLLYFFSTPPTPFFLYIKSYFYYMAQQHFMTNCVKIHVHFLHSSLSHSIFRRNLKYNIRGGEKHCSGIFYFSHILLLMLLLLPKAKKKRKKKQKHKKFMLGRSLICGLVKFLNFNF